MKTKLTYAAVRAAENAQPDLPRDYDAFNEAVEQQKEYLLSLPFSEIFDIAVAQGFEQRISLILEKLAVRTLRDQFSPY